MKNSLFFLLAASFIYLAGNTQQLQVEQGISNKFEVLHSDYQILHFSISLAELNSFVVKHKTGYYNQLTVEGYGLSLDVGNPGLPVMKKLIEVPEGAVIHYSVIREEYRVIDLAESGIVHPLFPAQPPVSKSIDNPDELPFEKNDITYQTNGWFGFDPVNVEMLGKMRGVNLARLEVAPLQYNPVQHTIRICIELEVEVSFVNGNTLKTIEQKKTLFSPYFEGIFNQVANYKSEVTDELIMDEPVTYIIVSDPMFGTALQPFIEWKTKKGFKVVEAYTDDPMVGTTTSSIKAYLHDFYTNPPDGCNPQSFVLFAGDVAQIPAFSGTAGSHVTDLYYCEYTGDIYPECYYGRFSANDLTELQPQIDKTLEYEQFTMPNPGFLDEVLMVAGDDESHEDTWGNGQINYGTTYYFNAAHGIYSHTFLQDPPMGNSGVHDSIIANMNSGISYGNYSAHCSSNGWASPSFSISDISSLTNAHKYPLLVGNCCSSVTFNYNCFGEEILRAADKGALGYIGGSNSTYWDEDYWWGVGYETVSANPVYNPAHLGAYDRTFHDNGEPISEWYITQGQMPSAGNLAVTQSGSGRETYYWEIYHLMGDPSVMIYMGNPPATAASYNPLMPPGTSVFTVSTEPYAYVAVSKEGVLHGAAVADASGVAEINLDPINVPGTADVVVTRQNGQPFTGTVTVASPSGPYLMMESFTIDDDAGNSNGIVDYDETVLFDINLENLGSSVATNVSATLTSTDIHVTINDNTQSWPDIPDGATSLQTGAFGITMADDVPDQHVAEFEMEITDGSETWNSQFSVIVHSPLFEAGLLVIDDGMGGNGNGRLDPGETVDVIITAINSGHSQSPNATAGLSSVSPYITVVSGSDNLGVVSEQSSADAAFVISCDPATPIGTAVDLVFEVVAGNYGCSETYYQSVGLVLEDWESGNFTKFPWSLSGDATWDISSSDPYEGTYCSQSGDINDNQVSALSVTVQTTSDGDISFFRKVSSETNWDFLQFWIDGVKVDEWSGEAGWSEVSYFVQAGVHIFEWRYDKDGSVSNGSDCAWVDYIVFPPIAPFEPDISVDPDFLDFGDVILGQNSIMPFSIVNSGTEILTGTVISPPAGFSVAPADGNYKQNTKNSINFSLNPGEVQVVEVLFATLKATC